MKKVIEMMMMMQRMMMMVMVIIPVNNCGSASVTVVGPNVQVPGGWAVNLGPSRGHNNFHDEMKVSVFMDDI